MARGGVPKLPPVTRTLDYGSLVRKAWGDSWLKKDVAYEFGNRKFAASDPNGGPYTGTATGT